MGFSSGHLLEILQQLSSCRGYRVAYSGGLDSQVLLYSLVQLGPKLPGSLISAIHINHGLHPRSGEWSLHCRESCAALGVGYEEVKVNGHPRKGESPEAAAREARYGALRSRIARGECLLTAQHQDDQVETLLLQLLRGGGPAGLAAMAKAAPFGQGRLLRPLLSFSRSELKIYAEQEGLVWVEDPSNFDLEFDRNYLRHKILPLLWQRWPGLGRTLSRAALHQADAAWLLDQQAQRELVAVSADKQGLSVQALQALAPPQRRNSLRYWFKQMQLPLPDSIHLQRILEEVLLAPEDAQPLVAWPGTEVRRYRDRLYAQKPLPPHDAAEVLVWEGVEPLALPAGVGGVLVPKRTRGLGLDAMRLQQNPMTIRFRQGGERIRLVERGYRCSLKKILQERGIPPWQRSRIPMVYVDDKLALVVGIGVDGDFAAAPGEAGVVIEWIL
ncbi:tRNA lysidine(34) synthetase TilS [Nitrosococcus watsonii]|uniref:tRNA(Ile)-lysidine synthase n=1 Tax=Nitrosococcus watsoni (strain C-113) TaxID=105559 RepID=D8K8G7_NITWC|nr:tRNA lysidine(34) synthetase TilS [Nitrosococcus watsonii]ADJ29087.1 tRNA(Ile)-lysidine synthetase [Nitrosococcus watsonii C-113]